MAGSYLNDDEVGFSEINVTPLVDVVLVLLIIFMMTAPVIYQNSIKVQLPQVKSGDAAQSADSRFLQYTLDAEGSLFVDGKKTSIEALAPSLNTLSEDKKSETVYIRADKTTPHGIVVQLMDTLKQAGLNRFALSVERQSK